MAPPESTEQAPSREAPWDRGMTFRTLRMINFVLYRTAAYAVIAISFSYTPWEWMRWLCGVVAEQHLIDSSFTAILHGRTSAPQPPQGPQLVAHWQNGVVFQGREAEEFEALVQSMRAKQ